MYDKENIKGYYSTTIYMLSEAKPLKIYKEADSSTVSIITQSGELK